MKPFFDDNKTDKGPRKNITFDYKDPLSLYPFLEGGKISPSRNNNLSRMQQRQLSKAIKKSRSLGLLPSHNQAYDNFNRPTPISLKPFEYK